MLDAPKGLKYWIETDTGSRIDESAPEWAKKEFEEYQKELEIKADKNGNIINR
ncbi:hypothetical protein M5C72_06245 [Companilactobacillus allii]|uniref:hypothetical protein n=1 Tax=Companilactobacillus allii TaxID=1847728 RepID=UPI0013DE55FD|nr:hypothetical protein [Companilactobacillus allii]USQ69814.1 hypothetical protein M5C72_06245 [Companilactobacillus allii]